MAQLDIFQKDGPKIPSAGASSPDAAGIFLPVPEIRKIKGTVEKVMYFNEETGQCVLDVKLDQLKSNVLVTGKTPFVHPGLGMQADIELTDSQYALLFQEEISVEGLFPAKNMKLLPPLHERATRKFLKSGALPGFGPHLATILAKNLFSVFDENSKALTTIHGVGAKKQKQVLDMWQNYKLSTELKNFLFTETLPLKWAKKLQTTYGDQALVKLRKSPYDTVIEAQLPFDLIDPFAIKYSHPLESTTRIQAAIFDALKNHYEQGHCAYPEEKLLGELEKSLELSRSMLEQVIELELLKENLILEDISGTTCIYLEKVWRLEKAVAERLLKFVGKEPPWGWINLQKSLGWAQNLLNIKLAPLQKEAIETALTSSLTVITGGPGTGKTTLIRSLTTVLQSQFSKFALCSPTGRAAQRLQQATAAPAQTIHRLLKYDPETNSFIHNQNNPLNLDVLLVDEMSMVDLELMSHLLNALPDSCALIMVGDADQIPPVGAGNVLQSVIDSKKFKIVKLTDIFRQREKSLIKINSGRINRGEMPIADSQALQDFHYYPVVNADETKKTIVKLVTEIIPSNFGISDPSQLQVLVPLNRGQLGTQQLNLDLQKILKTKSPKNSLIGFEHTYELGDKVMVVKNDYKKDVYNGDVGFIVKIDQKNQFIEIQIEERLVRFDFEELDRITLAYAISIHKSQGSEYRAVIVVIADEHLPMAQRHLIYTAVTRGKEHVFLVANPSALQTAILSDENNKRWQRLTDLLSDP